MKIIIIGCGKVGEALAAQLNEEGNNITVVDEDAETVKALVGKYDIMGVIGNGATISTLIEAGVATANLVIAVTGTDEINLLSCILARRSSNCLTIARVRSPEYFTDINKVRRDLGIAMIVNPDHAAACEIARILNFPSAINIETFAKGRVELLKFKLPEKSPLAGLYVKEVVTKLKCNVLVCTVERSGEALIPRGDLVFAEGDLISIIASPKNANAFFKKINFKVTPVKAATIVGGGNITHYLCDTLSRSSISLKVIEKNPEVCEALASDFDHVTVINGDPSDEATLREEGAAKSDAFVALTGLDEENILLSLFAKRTGKCKTITKINRIEYDDVINHLDLDSIVYPKNITANTIVRYVRSTANSRSSSMENLYNIIKGQVVAAEFVIGDRSPISDKPLKELNLKDDVLIAAILRERAVIIPRGNDVITSGDSVVIVTKQTGLCDITDILKK